MDKSKVEVVHVWFFCSVKEEIVIPKTLNHNVFYRMQILRRENPWSSRWKRME